MPQFIAYATDQWGTRHTPIAAGPDKYTVTGVACRRVLLMGAVDGEICIQERQDISAEDFNELLDHLNKFFTERFPEFER